MSVHRAASGKWIVRYRDAGRNRSKTFSVKADADRFDAETRRRKELGELILSRRDVPTLREVQVDDITQAALEVAGHESWLNGPDVCVLSADPAGGQMATIFDDEGNKIVLHGSIGFGSEADDEHKANLVLLLNELGFPQAPVLLKTKSNGLTLQASGDATLHNIEVE